MTQKICVYILFVFLTSIWLLQFDRENISVPQFEWGMFASVPEVSALYEIGTILFVGDILLGRRVERMSDDLGDDYPFEAAEEVLQDADITIGNFEASIPRKHVPTPDLTFSFSVKEKYLEVLKEHGFDVLSLANNHSFDHGKNAYVNTQEACRRVELVCGGHPYKITDVTSSLVSVGDTQMGILYLYEPSVDVLDLDIKEHIQVLKSKSDIQVVYIHWGEEYQMTHSTNQESIAHFLINEGVDTIIGHHPHVVQDIEIYKDKLIVYSLGNFIFDQYFSDEVQKGLGVKMNVKSDVLEYQFIAFSSVEKRSQPKPMSPKDATDFFSGLQLTGYAHDDFLQGFMIRLPRETN